MPNKTNQNQTKILFFLHPFPVRKGGICYDLWTSQHDSSRADRESLPTTASLTAGSSPRLCCSLLLPKNAYDTRLPLFLSLHHPASASPPRKVRHPKGRCLVHLEGARRRRRAVTDRKPFTLISLCRTLAFLLRAVSPLMRSTYPALPSHLARPSLPPSPAGLQGFGRGSRFSEEAGRGYVRG